MRYFTRLFFVLELLLLLVLLAASSFGQQGVLAINKTLSLDTANLQSSTFSLPQSTTSRLSISVALCGTGISNTDGDSARIFVTNDSAVSNPGPSSTESDVYEIILGGNGMGNMTLLGSNGGVLVISTGKRQQTFEVGVSDNAEPVHELLTMFPLLGDTTANQALLISPAFLPLTLDDPTYPNYTLPDANLSAPDPPTTFPNFTLVIGPTSSFPQFNVSINSFVDDTPLTACTLMNRGNLTINTKANLGSVQSSLVLRDERGWRTQWIVGGLEPVTNYTAFVIQDDAKVSGPINFVTKSASFACPLVHSLPYCPLVSYAVALPSPSGPPGTEAYDASTLPGEISGPLISYMSNFTTSLLTFACGRDWYSSLVGCSDCQAAYRTWLCAIQLPRCGEAPPSSTTVAVSTSTPAARKKRGFWKRGNSQQQIILSPALSVQNGSETVRRTSLPTFPGNWTQLLPCLETCNAVERACPPFLQFTCPVPRFTARDSYGVGFIDGDIANPGGEWREHGGATGVSQDRWGNVWCNGPGLAV